MKPKKCKFCKGKFTPKVSTTEAVCSYQCAIELSKIIVTKQRNQNKRLERDKLKSGLMTKGDYEKALQTKINYMVRLIDEGCNCIGCNKLKDKLDAGHFESRGSHSYLKFQ
jgi:transcriptional regulator NrdR family protein